MFNTDGIHPLPQCVEGGICIQRLQGDHSESSSGCGLLGIGLYGFRVIYGFKSSGIGTCRDGAGSTGFGAVGFSCIILKAQTRPNP